MIIILILLLISIYLIMVSPSGFSENIDDIIGYPYTQSDLNFANLVKGVKDPGKQIKVVHYGCFKDLNEKFFTRKINPFSTIKTFDSVFVISNENDFSKLLDKVRSNGFVSSIDYKKASVQELGALALFAGYSYVSICKESPDGNLKIYLSYSPPMTKHNVSGQFTSQEYEKYLAVPEQMKMCGYPCNAEDVYGCGSITYPNIKSPSLYSVYYSSVI
jgi:hypothetical protein